MGVAITDNKRVLEIGDFQFARDHAVPYVMVTERSTGALDPAALVFFPMSDLIYDRVNLTMEEQEVYQALLLRIAQRVGMKRGLYTANDLLEWEGPGRESAHDLAVAMIRAGIDPDKRGDRA